MLPSYERQRPAQAIPKAFVFASGFAAKLTAILYLARLGGILNELFLAQCRQATRAAQKGWNGPCAFLWWKMNR